MRIARPISLAGIFSAAIFAFTLTVEEFVCALAFITSSGSQTVRSRAWWAMSSSAALRWPPAHYGHAVAVLYDAFPGAVRGWLPPSVGIREHRSLDTFEVSHLESDRPVGLSALGEDWMAVATSASPLLRDQRLNHIWDKVQSGARLTRDDGLLLFETEDLHGVGRLADIAKSRRHGDHVFFVMNRYVNPTNVCVLSCSFCDFARKKGEAGAFENSIEDVLAMIKPGTREVAEAAREHAHVGGVDVASLITKKTWSPCRRDFARSARRRPRLLRDEPLRQPHQRVRALVQLLRVPGLIMARTSSMSSRRRPPHPSSARSRRSCTRARTRWWG